MVKHEKNVYKIGLQSNFIYCEETVTCTKQQLTPSVIQMVVGFADC